MMALYQEIGEVEIYPNDFSQNEAVASFFVSVMFTKLVRSSRLTEIWKYFVARYSNA